MFLIETTHRSNDSTKREVYPFAANDIVIYAPNEEKKSSLFRASFEFFLGGVAAPLAIIPFPDPGALGIIPFPDPGALGT